MSHHNYANWSDEELWLAWFRNRDQAAAHELYRHFFRLIWKIGLNLGVPPEDCEDLVAATLMQVFRATTFDPNRNLKRWIYQIARNEAFDLLKENRAWATQKRAALERYLRLSTRHSK